MKTKVQMFGSWFLLAFLVTLVAFPRNFTLLQSGLEAKLPQLVTVFVSVVLQALPFVLIGVFGAALLQNFITVEMIEAKLAHCSRIPGILMAIGAGFCFPVCDCGVIPVVRRLLIKRVPPYMAMAFLVTAPLVNPITIWATATAFGYNLPVTLLRVGMAVIVGIGVALVISKLFPKAGDLFLPQAMAELEAGATPHSGHGHSHHGDFETGSSCNCHEHDRECGAESHDESRRTDMDHEGHCRCHETVTESECAEAEQGLRTRGQVLAGVFEHANEEFLEVVKFLIIGALIAATLQTFIPKAALLVFTSNPVLSVLMMMGTALLLSLCAEADAFVARSFTYHFPLGSVMAFMVFGQMFDLKNTALLLKYFKPGPIFLIIGLCAVSVFLLCLGLNLAGSNAWIWGRF